LEFTINSRTDISQLSADFSKQNYVRVFDFLEQSSVTALTACVVNDVPYKNAFFLNGANREASDDDISGLAAEQRRSLYQEIYQDAAKGAGFLYGRHKIELDDSTHSLPEVKAALKLINSDTVLNLIRQITGMSAIKYADAQVTRFRVGDFLTRHIDDVAGETRKFAYVIGLSESWHPDWGGLLQFFERNGTPQNALAPKFNSLSLFDVRKVHSVTSIAAFSPRSRFSITGWFRI